VLAHFFPKEHADRLFRKEKVAGLQLICVMIRIILQIKRSINPVAVLLDIRKARLEPLRVQLLEQNLKAIVLACFLGSWEFFLLSYSMLFLRAGL